MKIEGLYDCSCYYYYIELGVPKENITILLISLIVASLLKKFSSRTFHN